MSVTGRAPATTTGRFVSKKSSLDLSDSDEDEQKPTLAVRAAAGPRVVASPSLAKASVWDISDDSGDDAPSRTAALPSLAGNKSAEPERAPARPAVRRDSSPRIIMADDSDDSDAGANKASVAARVSASPAGNGLAKYRSSPSKSVSSLIAPDEFVVQSSHLSHPPKFELSNESGSMSSIPTLEKRPLKKAVTSKSISNPVKKEPRIMRATRGNAWDLSSDSDSEISGNKL